MLKDKIRKDVLNKRLTISKGDLQKKSLKIKDNLFSIPEFIKCKNVVFYMSIKNEVFTNFMIQSALRAGKKIFLPVVKKQEEEMEVYEFSSFRSLVRGRYTVLEPDVKRSQKAGKNDLDIVVMPGIVFDCTGNRIGYGKGYFDRFLNLIKKDVLKIALAFDFQVVRRVPVTEHDVRVDKIVTETEIIDCND